MNHTTLRFLLLLTTLAVGTAAQAQQPQPSKLPEGVTAKPLTPNNPMVRDLDKNGDGVISHDEFMSKAEERFSLMDKNHDGRITQEESDTVRAEMMKKVQERQKMFSPAPNVKPAKTQ